MEGVLATAGTVGLWSGTILWVVLLLLACFTILVALPGGWIALGLAILYDLLHGFDAIGWQRLLLFAALLGVGEGIEALLGSVYVAKRGATRYGVIGTFVGGLAGGALGTAVMPVVGTVVGGFAGAFLGAAGGELLREQRVEPSLRIGFHATVGRLLAVTTKYVLAMAGILVVVVAAFRAL
jgi:uncharacterized protein YqgC (DUF456 family)